MSAKRLSRPPLSTARPSLRAMESTRADRSRGSGPRRALCEQPERGCRGRGGEARMGEEEHDGDALQVPRRYLEQAALVIYVQPEL